MTVIIDPALREKRKADQLKRLKKKGWKPPKGKANASH